MNGAITVFRSVSEGATLWESVLPTEMLVLPADLAAVDGLLAGWPGLVDPFRACFDPVRGRPSIPMETYLRLMFLKDYLDVGYQRLRDLVVGSVTFQMFARIGLGERVPDASTLKRITKRCGPGPVAELNQRLLGSAQAVGLVDLSRVRVDTTVVDANIAYPTDSGLLTNTITKLVTAGQIVTTSGLAVTTTIVDVSGEVADMNCRIGAWLRTRKPERTDEILILTDQLADLAKHAIRQAEQLAGEAMALIDVNPAPKGVRRALNTIEHIVGVAAQIIHQAKARARERPLPAAEKRLSLHDGDARPIRKRTTPRKGTQFGYTAEVTDNIDGLIVDYALYIGQPADSSLIGGTINNIIELFGTVPPEVTADHGYGSADARQALTDAGVQLVAIKAKGNPNPDQQQLQASPPFKALTRWRSGIEARISTLKRDHGWDRARMPNLTGAQTWCGWGIFGHNLVKLGRLL